MWLCWPHVFSYLTTIREACRVELRQTRAHFPDLDEAYRRHSEYRRVFIEQRLPLPSLYASWGRLNEALHSGVDEIGRWYRIHA